MVFFFRFSFLCTSFFLEILALLMLIVCTFDTLAFSGDFINVGVGSGVPCAWCL